MLLLHTLALLCRSAWARMGVRTWRTMLSQLCARLMELISLPAGGMR